MSTSILPPPSNPAPPLVEFSAKFKRFLVPFRADIANLVPATMRVDYKGQDSLVLPHNADAVRLVRNMGIEVPPPILARYGWPVGTIFDKPFHAQKMTASMLTMFRRAYVLNGMGTGKTRSALWAYDFLRIEGDAHRMLVVAPLSTLERTWAREIFGHFPHLRYAVLHGDKDKRLRRLADMTVDIYIINHDGVSVIFKELVARTDIDVLCLDELGAYRNGSSQRNKTMRKLAATKARVWGMTGTPTPNEPTDAWGQAMVVTPMTTNFTMRGFRERTMLKITEFKWVPKPTAQEEVHKLLQPSVRFSLDDVVELPECVMQEEPVTMGAEQAKTYEQLRKHLHMMHEKGELTVANAGVLTNKLLQVSLGWVYTDNRGVIALDNAPRMEILNEKIESCSEKVIVFVPFTHALEGVAEYLRGKGHTAKIVSGDTPAGLRGKIFTAFQDTDEPRVLVAHPACMAHGLTLTRANTIIWFGPYPNNEIFTQANARITRVGQNHKQLVVMLAGSEVERRLYRRLRDKLSTQNVLLDMFAKQDSVV